MSEWVVVGDGEDLDNAKTFEQALEKVFSNYYWWEDNSEIRFEFRKEEVTVTSIEVGDIGEAVRDFYPKISEIQVEENFEKDEEEETSSRYDNGIDIGKIDKEIVAWFQGDIYGGSIKPELSVKERRMVESDFWNQIFPLVVDWSADDPEAYLLPDGRVRFHESLNEEEKKESKPLVKVKPGQVERF